MARQNLKSTSTEHGTAFRTSRFKLIPRREPVLGLLTSEDLFPFGQFSAVKEVLVPNGAKR